MNEFENVPASEELDRYGRSGGFATTREVSDFLGWSPKKIRLLCRQGKLDFIQDPTCIRPTFLVQRASVARALRCGKTTTQGNRQHSSREGAVLSSLRGQNDR
jgi:hypothetical protein